MGLHLSGTRAPQRSAAEIYNKRRPLGRTTRAQGPSEDKVWPRRRPHTYTIGVQVEAMAIVPRGQGGKQTCLLVRNQAFHQQHLDLPTFFYLEAHGPKRLMHGIMEHARGWCK